LKKQYVNLTLTLTNQHIMKNSTLCLLCQKGKDADFIARCGHIFHDDCIKKNFECPKCEIKLIKSKVLEAILFKAFEKEYNYYAKLVSFCELLGHEKCSCTKFETNLLIAAINHGLDLNVHSKYSLKLLKYICDIDSVHALNKLFDLGLKKETIKTNFDPQIWEHAFEKESFCVMRRLKNLGLYPKELNGELMFDFRLSKWLIENEFEANHGTSKSNLIFEACKYRKLNTLKQLLESGADIDSKDCYGRSLFHRIVFSFFDHYKYPIEGPLGTIALNLFGEYLTILRILLDSGANIETVDNQGVTPLYTALKKGNIEVIYFLLLHKANLKTTKINELGGLLPHILTELWRINNSNKMLMFIKLFDHVTGIDEIDSNRNTGLEKTFEEYRMENLIKQAEVNFKDFAGNTPLHYLGLAQSYQLKKVMLLFEPKNVVDFNMNDLLKNLGKE
jgi:ankyrin repeat protein